jgi:hypothetical protein
MYPLKKFLPLLDSVENQIPAPSNRIKKSDPLSASASEIATTVNTLWEFNEQTNLPGKSKDDHVSIPMSHLNHGQNGQPGFGVHSVTQKLSAYNIIRVLNIIKSKLIILSL